ncbi:hypothetical protein ACFOET_00020 [Parapedobacter deserti]|uniref:Uncharacterized protein n=1 Tax=Parapedobacter deserti TaxID=1912957 RepID=A0ABV7JIA4_9SPHI
MRNSVEVDDNTSSTAMLLEKLIFFLEMKHGFRYTRGDHQLEIWLSDREELPIVISQINANRYIISSGDITYEVKDAEQAYRYVERVCFYMSAVPDGYRLWSKYF